MPETNPILKEGKKEHIVLVHDESMINDNDSQHNFWLKADEHVLKKKKNSRSPANDIRLHLPAIWEFGSDR
jgi:hypothetical protein